jgi:hypothetical protein
MAKRAAAIAIALLSGLMISSAAAEPAGLEVGESGATPHLKVIVTAPGVYKATVAQSYGGGIAEFYNLSADPEAKVNVAGRLAGLFEVGWHGATWKRPEGADPKTCCVNHSLGGDPAKPCYDGVRLWPWESHEGIEGELRVIEKSAARVRVRTESWFAAGSCPLKIDKDLPVTAVYTFYPSGRVFVQVRVRRTGALAMHWSREYGPHLFVGADNKNAEADLAFTWSTPESGEIQGERAPAKSEALVLTRSEKAKTNLMVTVPPEEQTLFTQNMRHNGRSVNWDRAGYGSGNIVMQPGYDSTWACMIEMGTTGGALVPELKTGKDALPFALDYRTPAKIEGATLVTDEPGDFNKDGFNESEGCWVLKSPGPVEFTFAKGAGAGFAPAFKLVGWNKDAPKSVRIDGKDVPCIAAVVQGAPDASTPSLLVQVMGTVAAEKAKIEIGK